jgi:hypothetical protein
MKLDNEFNSVKNWLGKEIGETETLLNLLETIKKNKG